MGFQYKINYTGKSKVIKRIVDKLNNLAPLGIEHHEAFYGDWGNEAYLHSLLKESNPHNVNLNDLGIEYLPRQVSMALEAIGVVDYWADHDLVDDEIAYMADHDDDLICFRSTSNLLAWH